MPEKMEYDVGIIVRGNVLGGYVVEVFTSNTRPLYILFVLLSTLPLIATRTLFCYLTYLAYDDPARLIFVPELL